MRQTRRHVQVISHTLAFFLLSFSLFFLWRLYWARKCVFSFDSWLHSLRRASIFFTKLSLSVDDETKQKPVDEVFELSIQTNRKHTHNKCHFVLMMVSVCFSKIPPFPCCRGFSSSSFLSCSGLCTETTEYHIQSDAKLGKSASGRLVDQARRQLEGLEQTLVCSVGWRPLLFQE